MLNSLISLYTDGMKFKIVKWDFGHKKMNERSFIKDITFGKRVFFFFKKPLCLLVLILLESQQYSNMSYLFQRLLRLVLLFSRIRDRSPRPNRIQF